MSDQQNLYTLAEASQLTGLSTEALRLRIKRGKLAAEKGNDGHPRLRLTSADLEEARRQVGQQKSTLIRQAPKETNNIKLLEGVVGTMREQWDRERKALEDEAAVLREAIGRERERADKAEARADTAQAERDAARAEALRAQVQAASAEGEAKGLRLALEEARRPFWRRWIG
jgi:multidrug resistance efflux pump